MLNAHSSDSKLLVALVDFPAKARKNYRVIVRRAIAHRSWRDALTESDLCPVSESKHSISIAPSERSISSACMFHGVLVTSVLWDECERMRADDKLISALTLEGVREHFWFFIGLLARPESNLTPCYPWRSAEEEVLAKEVLRHSVRWLDTALAITDRLELFSYRGWSAWAGKVAKLCFLAGLEEDRALAILDADIEEAKRAIDHVLQQ